MEDSDCALLLIIALTIVVMVYYMRTESEDSGLDVTHNEARERAEAKED